jgi:hypothetical protein
MNSDLETIARLTDPKPDDVCQAELFAEAAEKELAKVVAQQPPDRTGATEATIARFRKAAVDYSTRHDAEVAIAREDVTDANSRVETAWRNSVQSLAEGFASEFDRTAASLAAEDSGLGSPDADLVAEQPWNTAFAKLHEMAQRLDTLTMIRDAYANMTGPLDAVSTVYEPLSRICELPDANSATSITNRCGRVRSGVRFWLTLTRFPGVTVKWQTREQQQAQPAPAHFARHAAALAEQHAQRERAAANRG